MAITLGTATDYRDLLDRLHAFLTTDPALVAANQAWQAVRWTTDATNKSLILKAPGLSGTDEIYCGIQSYENPSGGYYNWRLNGFIGYNPNETFLNQPGAVALTLNGSTLTDYTPKIALWNDAIPYWFVANGRRVVVVAKVSTVYEAAYLGFIRPYATPGQYPYPLLVGGSMNGETGQAYTLADVVHRHFVDPGARSRNSACQLRSLSGAWLPFKNWESQGYEARVSSTTSLNTVWPYAYAKLDTLREGVDGQYPLTPVVLSQYVSGVEANLLGELEGVYHVSGFGNAAENTVSVEGVDHLVVPNVARNTACDFWALRLE